MSDVLTLRVKHTLSFKNEPLSCVANLPGEGADLYPVQMRALALALLEAADDCEGFAKQVKQTGPASKEYVLSAGWSSRDHWGFDPNAPLIGARQ